MLLSLLGAMDTSIVATALPTIVGEFNQIENISWVIAGYTLAIGLVGPVFGKLADKYGSAKLVTVALVLFIGASVLCGAAPNIYVLTIGRVLQGLGGGGLGLMPFTVLSHILPERSRPKYMAPMSSVWTVAAIAGPILGGVLTDTVGWRWIFFINLPIGAVAWYLASRSMPKQEQLHQNKLMDWHTLVLFAVATVLLVVTSHAVSSSAGQLTPESIFLLVCTLLASAVFVWRLAVAENPVIPIRIFANRGALTILLIGTLSATNLFAISGFIPTLLQMGFDIPATLAGMGLVPMVICMSATAIITSRRVSKSGHWRHFYIVGPLIAGASMFAAYFLSPTLGPLFISLALGMVAVGIGLFGMLNLTMVQAFSQSKTYGSVTATVNVARDLVGTVVTTISGGIFGFGVVTALTKLALPAGIKPTAIAPTDLALLDAATKSQVQQAYIAAFQPVFLNSALAYLLVFALALTLPRLELKRSH